MNTSVSDYQKQFREAFGRNDAAIVVRSPGRVNLIGEHTDYNEGFVLPASIDKAIVLVMAPRNDMLCRLRALDLHDAYECDVRSPEKSPKGWPNYILGVVDELQRAGYTIKGFDCVFGGNIPIGAGMSSSAAIEGGVVVALNTLFSLGIDQLTMVKIAQRAENKFVGVNCGIMDQFINIFGKEKRVLKIDCRSLAYEYVPFERENLRIVLCDTQVRRSLATSEYNVRRAQCEQGVAVLRKSNSAVRSLRDVSSEMLTAHRNELDPVVYSRCSYIVQENLRVTAACQALERNDFAAFGCCMFESHAGLRDQYQVSCSELDLLVELASRREGVYGARMMGAGFGGCTINLVEADAVDQFSSAVAQQYSVRMHVEPKIYISTIQAGTTILTIS